jgi:hypothetical protein
MRHLLPLTLLATLSIAAPAGAQAIATATPPKAGGPTKLHFDIDGLQDPVSQRIPSALTFSAPAGFTLDTRAFSARCSRQHAILNECPGGSAMGTGTLVIGVTLAEGARDATFPLHAYMSTGNKMWMIAYVTGWRIVPGTILVSADGLSLVFDPLPTPPPFENVSYAFKRITLDVGATRVIKKVVRAKQKRGSKRQRARVKKTRVDLIHAPAQCPGNWPASVTLTFPDGSGLPLPAPMPCAP